MNKQESKPVERVRERMSQGRILRVTMTKARWIGELRTTGYGHRKGHAGGKGQGSGPRGRRGLRTGAHARESSGFMQFSSSALRQIQVTKQNVSRRPLADLPSAFCGL